ncbi:MAG: hypothetical protein Q9216_001694 [Gyalolechia sp. 2 TL-2023]
MAPTSRTTKSKPITDRSASASDVGNVNGNEPRGSQGSDDHIVKDMANALKKSTKKRRDARRNKIEKEYILELERLQTSAITSLKRIASQKCADLSIIGLDAVSLKYLKF